MCEKKAHSKSVTMGMKIQMTTTFITEVQII